MSGLWIAKKKHKDLILPRSALTNRNTTCRKCGKEYSWQIGRAIFTAAPNSEEEDNRSRAAALFSEYRDKGIGPCCAHPEHRNFISRHSGSVVYQ